MKVYFDIVDAKWRIRGHEEHMFSTEEDAYTAYDFALDFAVQQITQEFRYRRAAERAKEQVVV